MSFLRCLPVLAAAAALAAPLAAGAQTEPAPAPVSSSAPLPAAPGHHHRQSPFFRALGTVGLTADQQQQVDTLRAQERAANAGADQPTRQANAAKMRDQIIGLLNPDQKTKLDAAWHHGHHAAPAAVPSSAPNSN